jgi:hypothetical protein
MNYSAEEIERQNLDDEERIEQMQREIIRRQRSIVERKQQPVSHEGEITSFADLESRRY